MLKAIEMASAAGITDGRNSKRGIMPPPLSLRVSQIKTELDAGDVLDLPIAFLYSVGFFAGKSVDADPPMGRLSRVPVPKD